MPDKKIKLINIFRLSPQQITILRAKLYRFMRTFIIGFILASTVNFVVFNFFYSPKVYSLTKENNELLIKYKLLSNKIKSSSERLNDIKNRDNGTYKTMFALDTLKMNFNDTYIFDNHQSEYADNEFNFLLQDLWTKTNELKTNLYLQSTSLDTIQLLALNKGQMIEAVPTIWPLDRTRIRGRIGAFGFRTHPILRVRMGHEGVDLAGPIGLPIYSTADGKVIASGRESGYGITVVVDHGYGYKTRYAHLNKTRVERGQIVRRGEQVGDLGNTGRSTGPHLHYEVLYRNRPVNPMNYLSRHMSREEYKEFIEKAAETIYEK